MKVLLLLLLLISTSCSKGQISDTVLLDSHIQKINTDGIPLEKDNFANLPMDSVIMIFNDIMNNGPKSGYKYLHPQLIKSLEGQNWKSFLNQMETYWGNITDLKVTRFVRYPMENTEQVVYNCEMKLDGERFYYDLQISVSPQYPISITYFKIKPFHGVLPTQMKKNVEPILQSILTKKSKKTLEYVHSVWFEQSSEDEIQKILNDNSIDIFTVENLKFQSMDVAINKDMLIFMLIYQREKEEDLMKIYLSQENDELKLAGIEVW